MKKSIFSGNTQFVDALSKDQIAKVLGGKPKKNTGAGDWHDSTSELASGGGTTDTYEDGYNSGSYTAGAIAPGGSSTH